MRILSLVPSWTETLVEAGLQVVGRTRFCIHPQSLVSAIPMVGGTKDIDWEKVRAVQPDLIIMDQEENPIQFSKECPFPFLATHVQDLPSLARELHRLSQTLASEKLNQWAQELEAELRQGPHIPTPAPPAMQSKLRTSNPDPEKPLAYVIWRDPWMLAGPPTFIGSMLQHLGWPLSSKEKERYPKITTEDLLKHRCLFSSEPYPFHKKKLELESLGLTGWIVEGESMSWFGIRALRFLQKTRTQT